MNASNQASLVNRHIRRFTGKRMPSDTVEIHYWMLLLRLLSIQNEFEFTVRLISVGVFISTALGALGRF